MRHVRWATIWTRSVHYIAFLCIWPHIIFIILLIIGVWTISFSGKKKKRFTKEKVLARLGRLTAPMGARPPLISPWSMASWWKKPCNFPVDFVYYRDKRYFELILIQSIKKVSFSANIGRCDPTCRVDVILFNSFWFICNVCKPVCKAVTVTHCKVH